MLNMWQQLYDPLNNIWLSSAVALIPIIFFFLALAVFRLKAVSRVRAQLLLHY